MVFSEEEYLAAIRENAPATTQEVADAVGVTRQGADYRLRRLEEDGLVTKQMVGNTLIWSVVEERERAETASESSADESPAPEPTTRGGGQGPPEPAREPETPDRDVVADAVEQAAQGWDDTSDRLDARKAAARAVLRYAVETGEAVNRGTAVDEFRDEYPVEGQNAETWWRNNARRVLSGIGEHAPGRGYQVTREDVEEYVGEE